jgi:hypothetical protein
VEALRAPLTAWSAEKPFLYSAESCRLDKKKFVPTRFAKNANSAKLFFARDFVAIYCDIYEFSQRFEPTRTSFFNLNDFFLKF